MGFQHLSKENRIEIARRGGTVSWQKGTAHRWTRQEAKEAVRIREEKRKLTLLGTDLT